MDLLRYTRLIIGYLTDGGQVITMKQILDLHIHSRYSRACSKELELPKIAKVCLEKGIDIVATGDFTHPAWFASIKNELKEENEGIYLLKSQASMSNDQSNPKSQIQKTRFILSTEISCIYTHKGKVRRLHLLVMVPSVEVATKFIRALEGRGVNLKADGRPIMGLSAKEILQILLEIDTRCMLIPAHAWTPWFAVFGSKSGYDSLEECFDELAPHIKAVETGLSSDPPMNHRLSNLDDIVLVSNSDAHSLDNLGREANVFEVKDYADITYDRITRIIREGDEKKFLYTIEFYPEEGKYHFDGHKDCRVVLSPKETKKLKELCPVCGKKLTVGVLHRVEDLADRSRKEVEQKKFIPHRYIVPLREIIAQVFEVGVKSKKVEAVCRQMINNIGNEFYILLEAEDEEIKKNIPNDNIFIAIQNMRKENVKVSPGYDGVFGVIDVLNEKGSARPKQRNLL